MILKLIEYKDARSAVIESSVSGSAYRDIMDRLDECKSLKIVTCEDCHWCRNKDQWGNGYCTVHHERIMGIERFFCGEGEENERTD